MPGALLRLTLWYASASSDLISFSATSGEPGSTSGAAGGGDLHPADAATTARTTTTRESSMAP
jgi:hypothetical protein